MHFRLEPNSGMPLGQQIIRQVRLAVAAGRVAVGDKLPSARDLAAELGVNFHTVRTAYGVLEDEGVLRTERGKGTFVAGAPPIDGAAVRRLVREHVERLASDLAGLGLSAPEVEQLLAPEVRACFPPGDRKASSSEG
jgi:DNA-binding transcriptional regulator YhcF (GntR family)